jgi:UDP-2,3-diacylglucosamine hydrolase
MCMKIIFISDLHLSPKTNDNNEVFIAKLKQWVNELDALYILGDFFDYWVGDDDVNPFTVMIKDALKEFTRHVPIYFIKGNHDFALGKRFAAETGIKYLKDCSVLTVNKKRILLAHGDVFCSLDKNYQRMKKILQNRLLIAILRKTPLSFRYAIKNKLEKESAKSYNRFHVDVYNIVNDTVLKIAHKYKADIVIHGHTHKPTVEGIPDSKCNTTITRFELPDWYDRDAGGYVILEEYKLTLNNHADGMVFNFIL